MRLKSLAIHLMLAMALAESLPSTTLAETQYPDEPSAATEAMSSSACETGALKDELLVSDEETHAAGDTTTPVEDSEACDAPVDNPLQSGAAEPCASATEDVDQHQAHVAPAAFDSGAESPCTATECEQPDGVLAESAREALALPAVAIIASPKTGRVIDIKSGSLANSARTQLWQSNSSEAQRFKLEPQKDSGFYLIRNVGSHKVLDVRGGRAFAGTVVQQYAQNGTAAQLWAIAANADGSYRIASALQEHGLQLVLGWDPSSNQLKLQTSGATDQNWLISDTRTIEDGVYRITSSESSKVLDVSGGSLRSGANAHVYASNGTNAQRFAVLYDEENGYYTIANTASGMVLDVSGASKKAGANVQFYKPNGTSAQYWSIERSGDSFRIVSRCSRLPIACSRKSPNPDNVIQSNDHSALSQQWTFETVEPIADGIYEIRPFANNDLCLDVAGGRAEYTTNVQLYRRNGTDAQSFEVARFDGDCYTIRSVISGLYVSVFSSSSMPKTNIQVDGGPCVDAGRLWRVLARPFGITFVSGTGLCIDVAGGKLASGTNVQGYVKNDTKAQQFILSRSQGKAPGITEFATESSYSGTRFDTTIRSLINNDESVLHVPADTDVESFTLLYAPRRASERARIALSIDGAYDPIQSGDSINLLEKARAIDAHTYELWVSTESAQLPRRLVIKLSNNTVRGISPHVYSHRGLPSERIEHSLQGYDRARMYGSEYIEQDVVCSADGTLFVSHDVTAQRLTGEKRAYDQMSDEEIESLKTSQGTPILRLEDVFKQYTDSITYVIELKDKNTVDFLLQLIDSYPESLGPIIVQSKDFEVLEAIHAGNNSIKTLLLARDENSVFKALSKSNIDIISVNQQLMNKQIIESVHSNNKEFNVWTLNTVDAIANAIQLGVDSYFTDFTQKAIPLELALRS